MIPRTVTALVILVLALCALLAAEHWNDDPHPLLIDAACSLPNPCDKVDCRRPDTRKLA